MRVMIVGARGQLGSDLIETFSDWQVTPYESEDMDISDEATVQQRVAFSAPDVVINSAAFTRVDECERENIRAFQVNALGAKHLALACRRWKIPLVHISTNYVFDGEKGTPYVEEDHTRPVNAYGITKLAGEEYVQYIWDKYIILRVSGLFGLTPSRMKGTNFVEAMIRLGSKGTPLRIVSDESLTPTYTKDAAQVIRKLVDRELYGIYHMSNKGTCTWMEFTQEIFDQRGMNVPLEPVTAKEYGAPAKRPKDSSLSVQKLEGLGLGPIRSWQDALGDYLQERKKLRGE